MNSKDLKRFSKLYGQLIMYIIQFQNGSIYADVMDDVQDFLSKGSDGRKAIKLALNKTCYLLDEMWDSKTVYLFHRTIKLNMLLQQLYHVFYQSIVKNDYH